MQKFIIKLLSTFFYAGYLPFFPGTFGSIAGIILVFLIKGNTFAYFTFTAAVIALGFLISGRAEKLFNKKDARPIVIDEVSGVFLSLAFIPYDIKLIIAAFVIFRILDALKPYPAHRLEKFKGSIGIMGDDIVAGIYTNIILQVVLRCASFKIS
jgi:phosphatidylglycerophosphatase A